MQQPSRFPRRLPRLLISLLALLLGTTVAEAALYKWVDENGMVHFTDKLPAESAEHQQEKVNKQGFTVDTIQEGRKTPEQLAEEERQQAIEEERKRAKAEVLRKQREEMQYNARLLRTYESLDDLIMVRDGKLVAIDSQISFAEGQIRERETLLERQHKHAAELERGGKKIDKKLQSAIDVTERQIATNRTRITELEAEKVRIRTELGADIERYKLLKGIKD